MSDPTTTTTAVATTPTTTTVATTTKPGYKTTEFWLALVAVLVGLLGASGAIGVDTATGKALAYIAAALASAGYSYSRAQVKAS